MSRRPTDLPPDEPTEVLDAGTDEWPVSDLYRVAPEADEAADGPAVVATQTVVADEPPARRRLPVGGAGLAAAIVLAVLGVGLGAWLLSENPAAEDDAQAVATTGAETPAPPPPAGSPPPAEGQTKEIADVVGMRLSNARAVLTAAGYRVAVKRQSSAEQPGQVLTQTPAAGRRLASGETVTLTVARRAQPVVVRVDVPDVLSLSVSEASAALTRSGLRAQVELVPSKEESGTVVRQNPSAGREVEKNTLVTLSVARRSETVAPQVALPDLVGSTAAAAQRRLRDLGLKVSIVRVRASEPAGTVVGQSPAAGARVREGASVRLRVSTGPESVSVPDVVGLDEGSARDELEAAGFEVRVTEEPTDDPANDGVVLRQSPLGGSSGDEGQVVTIVLGRFD